MVLCYNNKNVDTIKKKIFNINDLDKGKNKLYNYFATNGFSLNRKREVANPILQQIQNCLNFIVISKQFFKHNKQIQNWIIKTSNKEREFHLIAALEEFFDIRLSGFQIMVILKMENELQECFVLSNICWCGGHDRFFHREFE